MSGGAPKGPLYETDRHREIADSLRDRVFEHPHLKKGLAAALDRIDPGAIRRHDEAITNLSLKGNVVRNELDALYMEERLVRWFEAIERGPKLEKPQGSAYHKVMQAMRDKRLYLPSRGERYGNDEATATYQTFLVEHDWAAAFDGAEDYEGGEIRLPYDRACFEMRVSGCRVVAVVQGFDDLNRLFPFVEVGVDWTLPMPFSSDGRKWVPALTHSRYGEAMQPVADLIDRQIRAITVALEAQVATADVVRAPYKLNREREKRGALPILDHHIIRLTRRPRPTPLEDPAYREPGRHKRLHFRRGHWRHYDNHKTWIKWMLVGDSDLGFIDKTYRL